MAPKSYAANERITDEIRRQILSGELEPGARIRQEEIAEQFGVSRLPIREALRTLEAQGLVTIVPATGAWVSSMNLAECQQLYLIRESLEPLVVSMAAEKATLPDIEHLLELAKEMERAAKVEDFVELDRAFHLASFQCSDASLIIETVERQWNMTQHYRRAYVQLVGLEHLEETHLEHRLIVGAMKRKDTESAAALMALHIRKTRLALLDHPEIFQA